MVYPKGSFCTFIVYTWALRGFLFCNFRVPSIYYIGTRTLRIPRLRFVFCRISERFIKDLGTSFRMVQNELFQCGTLWERTSCYLCTCSRSLKSEHGRPEMDSMPFPGTVSREWTSLSRSLQGGQGVGSGTP